MTRNEERREPVAELNENDVLLGRGAGFHDYIGNKKFRALVDENRDEYVACSKHKEKNAIARRVFDAILSSGGRFLCVSQDDAPVDDIVEDGIWYVETNIKVCMEKCRQALRQKNKTAQASKTNQGDPPVSTPAQALASIPAPPQPAIPTSSMLLPQPSLVPVRIPSALVGAAVLPPPAILDARLLLYQRDLHMRAQLQQDQMMLGSLITNLAVASYQQQQPQAQLPVSSPVAQGQPEQEASKKHGRHYGASPSNDLQEQPVAMSHYDDMTSFSASVLIDDSPAEDDEDVSEYLLSVLALSGRSKFTDEQDEAEKANMTDQEKAKVLCDLFGKYCSVHHQDKKAKRDLDPKDIAFLVKQMRVEIEKIPASEKEALMEAQQKCNRPEEFSDHRLEQFLRCEGMDVKLGARRFSNYWNARRSVFGNRFLQRMALSDALRDDITALETGIFCLLPQKDLSGRQMLYMDPSRHSRDGYTSESLLRSIWYVIEMAAQETTDISGHAVQVVWFKNTSIFDYDKVFDLMHDFEANCWPLRKCSSHVCCPQSYTMRVLKPIVYALMDMASRARMLFHTVPESELLPVLADFGIQKEMVPTDMGGTLKLDQKEWIAKRRAEELELEEL